MRQALELARRGVGQTSPNPAVGAVLVRGQTVVGEGWHQRAGGAHAEIEAMQAARSARRRLQGTTLYVTLEPCSTEGRTPPCTEAILKAGISRIVVGATDPNPAHQGRGVEALRAAGVEVRAGLLEEECRRLNRAFNHWIIHQTPWTLLKSAMTLDGKIATAEGRSRWITGTDARQQVMQWRQAVDAILVGVETVLHDDPALTIRLPESQAGREKAARSPRRVILDSFARTPLDSKVVRDRQASQTVIAVTRAAPREQVAALKKKVEVWEMPAHRKRVDLVALMRRLGEEEVTHLMVEGGGEVHASFLEEGLAHEVAFFYAPKILGGHGSRRAVGGGGARSLKEASRLKHVQWTMVGPDLLMRAEVDLPDRKPRRASRRGARQGSGQPSPQKATVAKPRRSRPPRSAAKASGKVAAREEIRPPRKADPAAAAKKSTQRKPASASRAKARPSSRKRGGTTRPRRPASS